MVPVPKSRENQLQQADLPRSNSSNTTSHLNTAVCKTVIEVSLRQQNDDLSQRLAKERAVIELARAQALESNKVAGDIPRINALKDEELRTLEAKFGLLQAENEQQLKNIKQLREINQLITVGKIENDTRRKQLQLDNPFGGDDYERTLLNV